jgi:hypothetical protein
MHVNSAAQAHLQLGYMKDRQDQPLGAAYHFAQARSLGLRGEERHQAGIRQGGCLLIAGHLRAALSVLAAVFAEARTTEATLGYAARALRYQVNVFQRQAEAWDEHQTPASLAAQQELLDQGMQWLRDVGCYAWRAGLQYHQAIALRWAGQTTPALDMAEESLYRATRHSSPLDYQDNDHVCEVARCALAAGEIDRAEAVLQAHNQSNEGISLPVLRWNLVRIRVFEARGAHEAACHLATRASEEAAIIAVPREVQEAHGALVRTAMTCGNLKAVVQGSIRLIDSLELLTPCEDKLPWWITSRTLAPVPGWLARWEAAPSLQTSVRVFLERLNAFLAEPIPNT